jgi:predicted nucleic acid-binding protein
MSQTEQAVPLFVDTNALVAAFNEDDARYEPAVAVLDGIQEGTLPYGPVFTSRYVLSETATTILVGIGHREAVDALMTVRESSTVNILDVGPAIFDRTADQFEQYSDQSISFIDHMNAVLADEYDIDHIFAFDEDFATLGFTRVPVDTDEP